MSCPAFLRRSLRFPPARRFPPALRPPLLPRPDCACFPVNLSSVPRRSLEAAISRRLRSLYPGDPGETRMDWRPNGGERGAYLVFASTADRLARAGAREKGSISSSALLLELARRRKRPTLGLFVADSWIELASCAGPRMAWSSCLLREGGVEEDLRRGLGRAAIAGERETVLVRADRGFDGDRETGKGPGRGGGAGSDAALGSVLAERSIGLEASLGYDEAVRRAGPERCAVFAPRSRSLTRRYATPLLVSALFAASASFAVNRRAGELERELRPRRLELAVELSAEERRREAELELERLEASYAALAKGRRPGAYDLIADAAARLHASACVLGFRFDGESVGIEAEGGDAFEALSSFAGGADYDLARLDRSVRSSGGRERYSITMRLRR